MHWLLPFTAEASVRTVRRRAVIAASAQEARQKESRKGYFSGEIQERKGPGNVNNTDVHSRFVQ